MTDKLIKLSHLEPIAKGSARLVYQHPTKPNLLIKILRNPPYANSINSFQDFKHEMRKRFKFHCQSREINEYLRLMSMSSESDIKKHLAAIDGFVDTDMGFGICVEAQRDRDGNLAKTYTAILKDKELTQETKTNLTEFFEICKKSSIIMGDFNGKNFVYAWKENQYKFVIIDGLGDKTLIPVRKILKKSNDVMKLKSIEKQKKRAEV